MDSIPSQTSKQPTTFKYDVAFSFLDRDLGLAEELSELLRPHPLFVFSERQMELVGNDGVDAFSEVFRRESRTVAVLFRQEWSRTKWTELKMAQSRPDFSTMAPISRR